MQGQDNTPVSTPAEQPTAPVQPAQEAPQSVGEFAQDKFSGIDLNDSQGIDLTPTLPGTGYPHDAEMVNHLSNVAVIASNYKIDKTQIASDINTFGIPEVRNQYSTADQAARVKAHLNMADQKASSGDAPAVAHHITKSQEAQDNKNPGAMEKHAVNFITEEKPQPSTLKNIAWRQQYMMNYAKQLEEQYQNEGKEKGHIGDIISSLVPLNLAITASALDKNGKVQSVLDIFDTGDVVKKQHDYLMGIKDNDEFVREFDKVTKDLADKAKTFGFKNLGGQIDVLNMMVQGTAQDTTLASVGTALDVATTAGGAAIKGATKAASGIKKVLTKVPKDLDNQTIHTGSLIDTAKQLNQQDMVAKKVSQAYESGSSNVLVDTPEAAAKNAAPYHEPLAMKDGTSAQVMNTSDFFNGVGSKLEAYKADSYVAEVAEKLRQVQLNTGLSPDELQDAIQTVQQKVANDGINFPVTAEHTLNENLEPVIRARISQQDGEGWIKESDAKDYAKDVFTNGEKFGVVKDITGKFHITVDNGLDELATIKEIEVKRPGIVGRTLNQIFHNSGRFEGSAPFGIKNPLGEIPKEVQSSGITAVSLGKDILKIKSDIYNRNINKLSRKEQRDLLKIADHYRNAEASEWPTEDEIANTFRTIVGKSPTEAQIKSWHDYKMMNDIDYTISNLFHRNKLKEKGYVSINTNSDNMELQNFIGKPIDSYTKMTHPRVYDAEKQSWRTLSLEDYDKLNEEGYKFFKMGDGVKVDNGSGKMTNIPYIMSKAPKVEDVPAMVLPYRANGRIQYEGQYFVRQRNMDTYMVNGEEQTVDYAPHTHVISESVLDAKRWMEKANKALKKLREVEAVKKRGGAPSKQSLEELESLWGKTRWQTAERYMDDVRAGKASLEHDFEVTLDRAALKGDEKIKKSSTGKMGDDDSDLDVMFNISRRGERKLDATDQPARLKSPFQTLDESFSKDVKKITFQNFVRDSAERFYKTFGEELKGSEPYANPIQAIIHGEFDKNADAGRKAFGRRYQMWLRNLARVGFTQDQKELDKLMDLALQYESGMEGASSGLSRGMIKAKYAITKSWVTGEPMEFMRAAMYKTTFGLGNIGAFIPQALTFVMTGGQYLIENPVMGLRSLRDSGKIMYALARGLKKDHNFLDKYSDMTGLETSSAHHLVSDYYDSGIAQMQRYMGQSDKYMSTDTMPALLEKYSDTKATLKKGFDKVMEIGDVPFNLGTQFGNFGGFTVSRLKLLEKYGNKALEQGSSVRTEYLKELRYETERRTFGQSGANNLLIQQASKDFGIIGTAVEMMTQYMQYPLKLLSAMSPKTLGGSAAYTTKEKWALASAGALLSGNQFLPFHNYTSSQMYLTFKENGWYDGDPMEWQNSVWNKGLLDSVATKVFGVQTNVGMQLTPFSPIESFTKMLSGESPVAGFAGGPMLNKAYSVITKWTQLQNLDASVNGTNQTVLNSVGISHLLNAIENSFDLNSLENLGEAAAMSVSSIARVKRLTDSLKNPNVMTSKGYSLIKANDSAAILNFIGINASPYDAMDFQKNIIDDFKQNDAEWQNVIRTLIAKRFEALNKGDYDTQAQIDAAYSAAMIHIPVGQRRQLVKSAMKNYYTPAFDYNIQKMNEEMQQYDLVKQATQPTQ